MPLLQCFRQWPKVAEQESHAYNCMLKADDSQSVGFLTCAKCKICDTNHIPLATAYSALGLIYVNQLPQCHSSFEEADEIPDYPHSSNEFLQDLFCSKAGRAHICGVPVFV